MKSQAQVAGSGTREVHTQIVTDKIKQSQMQDNFYEQSNTVCDAVFSGIRCNCAGM